jgi:hypothetical protein
VTPAITLPPYRRSLIAEACVDCGERAAVGGPVRLWTAQCQTAEGQPVRAVDRWVLVYHWQCLRHIEHSGYWYETTDEMSP